MAGNYKYYAKVKGPNGKDIYFYTPKEYIAYKRLSRINTTTDDLKNNTKSNGGVSSSGNYIYKSKRTSKNGETTTTTTKTSTGLGNKGPVRYETKSTKKRDSYKDASPVNGNKTNYNISNGEGKITFTTEKKKTVSTKPGYKTYDLYDTRTEVTNKRGEDGRDVYGKKKVAERASNNTSGESHYKYKTTTNGYTKPTVKSRDTSSSTKSYQLKTNDKKATGSKDKGYTYQVKTKVGNKTVTSLKGQGSSYNKPKLKSRPDKDGITRTTGVATNKNAPKNPADSKKYKISSKVNSVKKTAKTEGAKAANYAKKKTSVVANNVLTAGKNTLSNIKKKWKNR